jgi:hypothetical protein
LKELDELIRYLTEKWRETAMSGHKASCEPFPLLRAQHLPEDGKACQKITFEVAVYQSRVDLHTMRLNTSRTDICLRIADMGSKCMLEALKLRKG